MKKQNFVRRCLVQALVAESAVVSLNNENYDVNAGPNVVVRFRVRPLDGYVNGGWDWNDGHYETEIMNVMQQDEYSCS